MNGNGWTILFEYNSAIHEHIVPIESDFMDGFAVRGHSGMSINPQEGIVFNEV